MSSVLVFLQTKLYSEISDISCIRFGFFQLYKYTYTTHTHYNDPGTHSPLLFGQKPQVWLCSVGERHLRRLDCDFGAIILPYEKCCIILSISVFSVMFCISSESLCDCQCVNLDCHLCLLLFQSSWFFWGHVGVLSRFVF